MLLMQNPDACWKCGKPPEENKKLVRCSAHLPGLEGEPIEAGCRLSVHPGCLGLWALPDGKWLCRTCADNVGLEHGGDQGVVLTPDELVNTPCYSISSLKMVEGAFVSGPVVRHTDETRARCFTNGYLRIQHDLGRCNGIEMISSRSLNKSSLFRYFILYVV